jgi:hypothetical protein
MNGGRQEVANQNPSLPNALKSASVQEEELPMLRSGPSISGVFKKIIKKVVRKR